MSKKIPIKQRKEEVDVRVCSMKTASLKGAEVLVDVLKYRKKKKKKIKLEVLGKQGIYLLLAINWGCFFCALIYDAGEEQIRIEKRTTPVLSPVNHYNPSSPVLWANEVIITPNIFQN